MPIKKQEFYEGAAIHHLVRLGGLKRISFDPPFFCANEKLLLYLKYSTKNRTPWGFTFSPDEYQTLSAKVAAARVVVGLICGFDGVAAVSADEILKLGLSDRAATRIACSRQHGQYYRVWGPDRELADLVPPSNWSRILHPL